MVFCLDPTHLVEKERIKKTFIGGPLFNFPLFFAVIFRNTVPIKFSGIVESDNFSAYLCHAYMISGKHNAAKSGNRSILKKSRHRVRCQSSFVHAWRSLTKRAGSGSVSQRYGSVPENHGSGTLLQSSNLDHSGFVGAPRGIQNVNPKFTCRYCQL